MSLANWCNYHTALVGSETRAADFSSTCGPSLAR